jgi:hypothetical protein
MAVTNPLPDSQSRRPAGILQRSSHVESFYKGNMWESSTPLPSDTLQFGAGSFYTVYAELRCTRQSRESNSRLPRAVAPGAFLFQSALSP